VVLLDGWQLSLTNSCPMSSNSSGTFDNLQSYLLGSPNFVPVVYFFENCTECPNCSIEQLGADLQAFLNSLSVPLVDVVAHSMGGLIVRSYLSGKQSASGAFSPPATQKIRKAAFLATPHFGSFQADSLFLAGVQTDEMKRGSQFAWDLARWNYT
jgi:triacylglycerol esterase/lipase EstA (alpha/beta hydrolase family)